MASQRVESGRIDLFEKGERGVKLNILRFFKGRYANSTYHTSKKKNKQTKQKNSPC